MIYIGNKPNEFTEKTLFKESMQDVDYTPILAGIGMMDPPDSIEKFKVEIRKFGENMKRKHKVKGVYNDRITLGYMEYLKNGFSRTD